MTASGFRRVPQPLTPAFGGGLYDRNSGDSQQQGANASSGFLQTVWRYITAPFRVIINLIKNLFGFGTKQELEKTQQNLDRTEEQLAMANDLLNTLPDEVKAQSEAFQQGQATRVETLRTRLAEYLQPDHKPAQQHEATNPIRSYMTVMTPEELPGKTTEIRRPFVTKTLIKQATDGKLDVTIPGSANFVERSKFALLDKTDKKTKIALRGPEDAGLLSTYPVKWSMEKCVRDIFQNFSDAHGATLAGVRVKVSKQGKTYTIRLEADGEYNHKMLDRFGATSKVGEDTKTGHFGEGAKVLSLILLREGWASGLEFASRDWKKTFYLEDEEQEGQPIKALFRELKQVPDRPGNYLQIKTDNKALVEKLIHGIDYFPHPGNPDFMAPTFENDQFGFKFHGLDKTGSIYLVNQRNEYNSPLQATGEAAWDNHVEHITLWTKAGEKKDRDRTDISPWELRNMLKDVRITGELSDQQIISLIDTLSPLWNNVKVVEGLHAVAGINNANAYANESVGRILLETLVTLAKNKSLAIDFSQYKTRYLADDLGSRGAAVRQRILQEGYVLCPEEFGGIGMMSASEYQRRLYTHEGLEPSADDVLRMNILREVAELYLDSAAANMPFVQMTPRHMQQRIKEPIYIFDRHNEQDDLIEHKNIAGQSDGDCIWVDQTHLRTIDFDTITSTYLHELTHKYGGDDSSSFSYGLTDWIALVQRALAKDVSRWQQLQDLRKLWNELNPEAEQTEAAA